MVTDDREPEAPNIFISYAHIDNEDPPQWVDELVQQLQLKVNTRWGHRATIWKDARKLQGNDLLTEKILSAIAKSTVIVSVLSPGYLASNWCKTELKAFCEAAAESGGLNVGTASRVFKVLKLSVDPAQLGDIPALVDTTSFQFFRIEGNKDVSVDPALDAKARADFASMVDDIAIPVSQILRRFLGDAGGLPLAHDLKIYLAPSSSDMRTQRYWLRNRLSLAGHEVLETSPDTVYTADYKDRVRAQLEQCRISIHPIGDNYATLENSDLPIDRPAYDLANEEARKRPHDFLRITWRTSKALPVDPRQRAFVELLNDDVEQSNMEYVEDELEFFMETFNDRVKAMLAPPLAAPAHSVAPEAAKSAAKVVYVLYDASRDGAEGSAGADTMRAVRKYLKAQNIQVKATLTEGDAGELERYHELMIRNCDGVLLYHGEASPTWLEERIAELHENGRGFGTGGYGACAVLQASPPSRYKKEYDDSEVPAIAGSEPFDPSVLAPFVAALCGTRAASP